MPQSENIKTSRRPQEGAPQLSPVGSDAQTSTQTPRIVEEWLADVEPVSPFSDERHLVGSFHQLVGLSSASSSLAARLAAYDDQWTRWQNPLGAIGEPIPSPLDQALIKIRNSKKVTPLRIHAWVEYITLLNEKRLRRTAPWDSAVNTALEFPTPFWEVLRTDEKWVVFSWEVINAVYDAKCFLFSLIPQEQQMQEIIQSLFCSQSLSEWIDVTSHFSSNTQQVPFIYQLATALGDRKAKLALLSALGAKLLGFGVRKAKRCDYYKLLTWTQEQGFYLPRPCSGLIRRMPK